MAAKRAVLLDKYFYFFMSLLIAVVVAYGFSHTVNQNLIHATPRRPLLLDFHACAFSAWVLFFIFQSALIRTHNVRLHRLTGWFGAALAATMVVLGYSIAVLMDRFEITTLHLPGTGIEAFSIIQFFNITAFAVLFSLAILWRKKPELHRRLILLATCCLLSPAFARFPINFSMPFLFYYGVDALMLLGVVRDLIVNRRIHKVYLCVLPVLFVCQYGVVYVFTYAWPVWMRIAHAIIG